MFFSVRRNYRIGGRLYQPCICYELTRELEDTIRGLAAKGTARLYNERVFFQNGNILQAVPEKTPGPVPDVPEKEPEPAQVSEPEPEPVYVPETVRTSEYEMAPEDDGIHSSSGLSKTQAMDSFNSLPESVRRMIMDADSESDY